MKKNFFKNIFFINKILHQRAEDIVARFLNILKKDYKILDLGSGSCHISELLRSRGYKVIAADIQNLSFFTDLKPVIYDGRNLPFKDNEFDVVLLITVLHHTSDPERIIQEAKRVANKLLIIEEDIYDTCWRKYMTFFIDSLLNLEFFGHPHTNKTDKDWRQLFELMGLKLRSVNYYRSHIFLRHATYVLEKKKK